jgi:hypothetical protein
MGLTCSLTGHDYASAETDRERTAHGTETVKTVRTTRTCHRCDHTKVLSETTEITIADRNRDGTRDSDLKHGPDAPAARSKPRTDGTGNPASVPWPSETEPNSTSSVDPNRSPTTSKRTGSRSDRSATRRSAIEPTAAVMTSRSLETSAIACPDCGFEEAMLGSALRPGDSCPDCVRGYLTRRTRKE